jgi:hypothetical protein
VNVDLNSSRTEPQARQDANRDAQIAALQRERSAMVLHKRPVRVAAIDAELAAMGVPTDEVVDASTAGKADPPTSPRRSPRRTAEQG